MDRYKAYIVPGAAAALLLAYYGWRWSSSPDAEPPSPSAAQPTAPSSSARSASAPEDRVQRDAAAAKVEPGPLDPPATPSEGAPKTTRDRAKRDALRDKIAAAQRTRSGREDLAEPEPSDLGQLSKEYLQARVHDDFLPLAQECYDNALEDDATLAGRLTLQIRIVGEPDVGGVVEEAEPTVDSEITHAGLVECMRESMLSMSFDPPEHGGAIQVTYPFVLSTDDPPQ